MFCLELATYLKFVDFFFRRMFLNILMDNAKDLCYREIIDKMYQRTYFL